MTEVSPSQACLAPVSDSKIAAIFSDALESVIQADRPEGDSRSRAQQAADAFVQLAEDSFEVRRVEVGAAHGSFVALLRGVRAGERVATTGSFLLKTETLKGSIGAGCCDVD